MTAPVRFRLSRATRRRPFDRLAQDIADRLTPEQAIKLYDFIAPLPENDPIRKLTDEELLQKLGKP